MDGQEAILREIKKQHLHRVKHGEGPEEVLDAETLRALDEGIRSAENGRDYTWEEVKQFARERSKAWSIIPDNLGA